MRWMWVSKCVFVCVDWGNKLWQHRNWGRKGGGVYQAKSHFPQANVHFTPTPQTHHAQHRRHQMDRVALHRHIFPFLQYLPRWIFYDAAYFMPYPRRPTADRTCVLVEHTHTHTKITIQSPRYFGGAQSEQFEHRPPPAHHILHS